MARTNRILAQAVLQILLPARGYTDIRFTADDKLTAVMPDGTEMAAVVTSRIIGEHTRESDVISIAPTKYATFDQYFTMGAPADATRRLLIVVDIDADLNRARTIALEYADPETMAAASDATKLKSNGGLAINFNRYNELKADSIVSGTVTIGD